MPVHTPFTRRAVAGGYALGVKSERDEPLPATLTFVFSIGILITLGWFAMFALLRARW